MKFRQHRGGLSDSLATTVDCASLLAIAAVLSAAHGRIISTDDVTFAPYGGDEDRTGWKDLHAVIVNDCIVGFSEGKF